ncbi:bifunctional diaminohydroxyphosphoribosylaminopyrimidine deaminase/5-amino-6-(5-phosphoribosylamino)uracil reductase RibD [Streptomyces sp. NBC_01803]|uniref:bifunctional diaminohydroxyphosphoribosylaminopyrimidine deaminase/5-amino-6-(5-phosphoribosylamino)uracil reductase RibD n=1 Tax=Streptomyces sp. NBC_01803 TaxID=2975946 RepID=UPI002DDAD361|nr:bifunctional diaminohydroxyphosphoribosylaminopyrimidine deaminase/5-amino-6-(5-phosphoribosylamino)uracil reductase RibD [Streptomyces sp. NBC_01803]WSA44945.1 bifunctional diaminohydroxyphosphoribosylaminopyrimidine deaminase/5-amino-6-(5-phosphoribosylamino)uracil reductase RibD [Streptomyces sp. NBC_01803]
MRISQLVGVDEWGTVEGRPYVVYKYAATLDGRIAAADSTSQWITSPESRAEVHALRAACQATVVGSGTQQADDPHLAVRSGWDDPRLQIPVQVERQPWRVVVDTNARTPKGARVLDDVAPTLIAVAEDADARHFEDAATVVRLPRAADGRGLELPALLEELRARGVRGMFLEGGPTLAASFVSAGLVDRIIAYIAPALLGNGKSALQGGTVETMADILRCDLLDVARSGPDVRLLARPQRP